MVFHLCNSDLINAKMTVCGPDMHSPRLTYFRVAVSFAFYLLTDWLSGNSWRNSSASQIHGGLWAEDWAPWQEMAVPPVCCRALWNDCIQGKSYAPFGVLFCFSLLVFAVARNLFSHTEGNWLVEDTLPLHCVNTKSSNCKDVEQVLHFI